MVAKSKKCNSARWCTKYVVRMVKMMMYLCPCFFYLFLFLILILLFWLGKVEDNDDGGKEDGKEPARGERGKSKEAPAGVPKLDPLGHLPSQALH